MGNNLTNQYVSASFQQLVQISGSGQLTDGTGSAIDNITITASFASQAGTSGYANQAGTAGYAVNASSASIADTSGYAVLALTSSHALYAEQAGTSGFATSASYAESSSADNLTLQQVTDNGATTTNGITVGEVLIGNRYYRQDSITSLTGGGTYVVNGGTNLAQLQLVGNSNTATNSITLNPVATDADNVFIQGDTKIDDNLYVVGDITGSNATFTNLTAVSASVGHLTTVTGSAVIIGDAYVVVNSSATTRYAGIKVYESGAVVPTTASLEFDSLTNDWFYEYTGSDPTNFGAVMFGPEYSTKGSPSYPTANTLTKGNGGHHLVDSSITDDGTDVVVSANISASGFVSASTYYGDGSNLQGITTDTGSLLTTASYSDPTLTFTKGDGSTFDITLATGGAGFPYTGSAEISGSLRVLVDGVVDGYTITSGSLSGSLVDNLGQQSIVTGSAVKHIVNLSQAEYDALSPDANTLYLIDGSETLGNTVVSGSLIGVVNTISDSGGTTTLDCSLGNYFTLAMPAGGSTTLTPSNIQIGQTINIKITQNATASTLAYAGTIEFPGGTAFTISTGAGEVDVLTLVSFDGTSLQATGLANFS